MIHLQILLQIVFFTRSVSAITMRGCEQGDLKLLKNEFATDLECNLSGRNDSTVTWSLIDENGEHATIGTCSNGGNCFVSADLPCKISRSEHSTKLHVDVVEDWMNGKLMCAESASEFTESANCSVRVVSVKMADCHAAKEHSDVIVDCISQPHSPSHISLTLTPKTGQTINIANCENVTRFMKCTPELPWLGSGTTGPMTCGYQTTWTPRHLYALIPRVNRTMAGTLECTYTHNGTTESDSCELDVVEPAQVEGCQVDISHSNWSAIVRCDVSQAYSSTQHYSFSATLHRKGTLAHRPVFEGRRVFSLLEEFVNRTNNLSYYRGQFAFSTPLSSTPGSDVAWGIAGGTVAVVAAPYAAAAAGFGAAGVAASSVAAKAMSVAWTTGVGAGGVGTLQAVGTAGLTMAQSAVVAGVAGTATTATKKAFFDGEQEDKCG